ncbi:MAG: hypothetical protein LBP69_09580 [Treponema sp.]|jgi:hypothetical protein|nr:hypothetical protein [Treponema sp.]
MRIFVVAPGEFVGDGLEPNKYYDCEPADSPTGKQNRAFHALCQCFWASGLHSYPAKSFGEFREYVKRDLGAGAEYYVYVKKDGLLKGKSKDREEAVREAATDRDGRPVVWARLKSWADYSKKERRAAIGNLIAEMAQAGVSGGRFEEILRGMEEQSVKGQGEDNP